MPEQQMDSFDMITQRIEGNVQQIEAKRQQEELERQKAQRERDFNTGLIRLAERVMEHEAKQDNTYFMLKAFLDVALQMQDIMKDLNSINDAMYCLTEAIGFIDDSLKLDQARNQETLQVNYGFFYRMKQRRIQKKVIKNNIGRIETLMDSMTLKYEMAQKLSESMAALGGKITKRMQAANEKAKKRAEKQGITTQVQSQSSASDEFLAKLRQERGGNAGGTNAPAPTAPPSGGTDSSSSGIDDILG